MRYPEQGSPPPAFAGHFLLFSHRRLFTPPSLLGSNKHGRGVGVINLSIPPRLLVSSIPDGMGVYKPADITFSRLACVRFAYARRDVGI